MEQSIETYNADVAQAQEKHGKLETVEAQGSRLRWGKWAEEQ